MKFRLIGTAVLFFGFLSVGQAANANEDISHDELVSQAGIIESAVKEAKRLYIEMLDEKGVDMSVVLGTDLTGNIVRQSYHYPSVDSSENEGS